MGEIIIGNHGLGVQDEKKCPKEWGIIQINEIKVNGNCIDQLLSEQVQLREHKFPKDLLFFYSGLQRGVPDHVPYEKPPWYDDDKFKLGQMFAHDYYGSVNYAEMLTLLVLFSFKGNLSPLIYTRRSDTTVKAAKRYLSTALRVLSWYEDDIWDKNSAAYKNIQITKAYHRNTVKRMAKHSKHELELKSRLRNVLPKSEVKCLSLPVLAEDFKGVCPFWLEESVRSGVLISQAEMSFTLFGFMGLIILYPEKLGILGATQEQLGGFVHLWRVIGCLLGIEDELNICKGSLEEVQSRCRDIVDNLFIPNLCNLNEEWEHMSRCMIEGVGMTIPGPTFEALTLHLFWMTGVQPKNYRKNMKWRYIVKHYFNRFAMSCIMRFSWVRHRFNSWVKSQMRQKAVTLLKEIDDVKDVNENR